LKVQAKARASLAPGAPAIATVERLMNETRDALAFEEAIDRIVAGQARRAGGSAPDRHARGKPHERPDLAARAGLVAWLPACRADAALAPPGPSSGRHARRALAQLSRNRILKDACHPCFRSSRAGRDNSHQHAQRRRHSGAGDRKRACPDLWRFRVPAARRWFHRRSRAIAEAYAAQDTRVRLIAMPRQGLVRSLNQLFAEARAPLVARFDADDICMPERLERQVAFLAANPDHGLVACETTFIDAAGAPAGNAPIRRPHDHDAILAVLEAGPILCHSAVMVRTDLVRAAGGYREAYVHAEDYDLRLRLAGHTRMANLPEYLLAYRISPGQVSSRHMGVQARNAPLPGWRTRREHTGVDPTAHLATSRGRGAR
jgi:hypothetical protein